VVFYFFYVFCFFGGYEERRPLISDRGIQGGEKKKEGYRAPSLIPDRACKRINKKEVIEDAPL